VAVLYPVKLLELPVLALAPVEPMFSFGAAPLQPTAIAPRTANKANVRDGMQSILPQPCCTRSHPSTYSTESHAIGSRIHRYCTRIPAQTLLLHVHRGDDHENIEVTNSRHCSLCNRNHLPSARVRGQ
jgi:hypothetical protein